MFSGHKSLGNARSSLTAMLLRFADLIDAPLVAAAFERRLEPQRDNLVREPERDDPAAHREDVGIVVLARQARGVEIVAERGADAGDLVGGDLLALPAAAEHDAALGAPLGDRAADREADRRIVHRLLAVRAVIVDGVPEPLQRLLQMFFEQEAGVIGADGDAHGNNCTVRYRSASASAFGSRCRVRTLSESRQADRAERNVTMIPTAVISARGEQRLRGGHPWIYRADVADVRAAGGDIVQVRSPRGRTLGLRALQRPIADHAADADPRRAAGRRALVRKRIETAIAFRESLAIDATAYRLVHGEADLLPSLIVDRYGDYLVVQALSQGMDRLLPAVVAA